MSTSAMAFLLRQEITGTSFKRSDVGKLKPVTIDILDVMDEEEMLKRACFCVCCSSFYSPYRILVGDE